MQFHSHAGPSALASLAGMQRSVFWLDRPDRPEAAPPLSADTRADLLVIGAGFTGLWTALLAKQADPGRDVLLVDGGRPACGASGRNGGFVAASLTHGLGNGLQRWPQEMPELLRLGHDNLDAIERTVREFDIPCDFTRTGELDVAVAPHQVAALQELSDSAARLGQDYVFLDESQCRARLNSPAFLAGVHDARGVALVDPARLAWGLRRACLDIGVRVAERTPVRSVGRSGDQVAAVTDGGTVRADRVALATNAYPPLLRRISAYVVPVYDYVLVTEPLTDRQWAAIGWDGREGVSDSGNQFHYFRVTADGRILWGGYDAMYHRGNGFGPRFDNSQECYERLAEHFLQVFPQLTGIRFTHGWGGAIDTCSRFSAFWGQAMDGRVAYVVGYTGLGVGASRFGAATMLDLLDGRATERTALAMVRTKPVPFPPEPLRSVGIHLTTSALARADEQGRRGPWLRLLDRFGLGFDS